MQYIHLQVRRKWLRHWLLNCHIRQHKNVHLLKDDIHTVCIRSTTCLYGITWAGHWTSISWSVSSIRISTKTFNTELARKENTKKDLNSQIRQTEDEEYQSNSSYDATTLPKGHLYMYNIITLPEFFFFYNGFKEWKWHYQHNDENAV